MVTRILFDPRRDLPDGTNQSNPVTVTATPTGIAENGSVVVLPTSLTFTINTGADVLQLVPSVASWAWRLVVRDAAGNAILQQRTVVVPDQASIAWQSLQDVDPASLEPTTGTARQWDATFGQIMDLLAAGGGGGLGDAGIATLIQTPSSAVASALSATYPALRSTPPDHTVVVAYIDTSTVPPVLKGWNGSTWVAIGGGAATAAVTTIDNGNGTFTSTGTGAVDNGDGTFTLTDSSVTDNGDGTFTLAA